jgi:hypothetical protein
MCQNGGGGGKTNSERIINDSILAIKQRDDRVCSAFELWCSILLSAPVLQVKLLCEYKNC